MKTEIFILTQTETDLPAVAEQIVVGQAHVPTLIAIGRERVGEFRPERPGLLDVHFDIDGSVRESIYRDLALVVDTDVSHQMILDIIKGFSLISEVRLFDVYSGKQVAAGKKSLAYRLVYQSPTHTLTDEEVNKVEMQILKKLSDKLGATLRG